MTKDELSKIVNTVVTNWNLQIAGTRLDDMRQVWWRYLEDIPYSAAVKAVDTLVVRDGYAPRVGSVRRLAMENNPMLVVPPEPADAWMQAAGILHKAESGLFEEDVAKVHPLILEVIKTGAHEYRAFTEIYEARLQGWRDETFGINGES